MTKYLLDTNVISEVIKPIPNSNVVEFIQAAQSDLWISAPSIQELVYGAECMPRGQKQNKIVTWISGLKILFKGRTLYMNWQAATLAGRFKNLAKEAGLNGVDLDAQIAGIAASNGLILATRNIKDFEPMGIDLFNPWDD